MSETICSDNPLIYTLRMEIMKKNLPIFRNEYQESKHDDHWCQKEHRYAVMMQCIRSARLLL